MTVDDKIRNVKLQYDINRETGKTSALNTDKEIIELSNWGLITEQAKFTYSPLGRALEKQTEKQVHVLKSLNLSNKKDKLKQIDSIFPYFNDTGKI